VEGGRVTASWATSSPSTWTARPPRREVARSVAEKWRKIPEPRRETCELRVPVVGGDKEEEAKPIEQRIGVCRVANAVSADVYGISMV